MDVGIEPTQRAPLVSADPTAPLVEPSEALEACLIGHFAVLRKLGEGGMGVAYVAYDERLERRVALMPNHGGDLAGLLREAVALSRLSHPHVVQIYEVGTYGERVFVAMEYVEGPTLAAWLAAAPRDAATLLDVFLQAGRGLAAAY